MILNFKNRKMGMPAWIIIITLLVLYYLMSSQKQLQSKTKIQSLFNQTKRRIQKNAGAN